MAKKMFLYITLEFRHKSVLHFVWVSCKGPYFNYVSTFLTIFDQLSNLVSIFTKQALFTKRAFWTILLTN